MPNSKLTDHMPDLPGYEEHLDLKYCRERTRSKDQQLTLYIDEDEEDDNH